MMNWAGLHVDQIFGAVTKLIKRTGRLLIGSLQTRHNNTSWNEWMNECGLDSNDIDVGIYLACPE